MKQGTTMHIGATKRYIVDAIEVYGPGEVLVDADEMTREEAIKRIMDDPREIFCSCNCRKEEDGSCSGEVELTTQED